MVKHQEKSAKRENEKNSASRRPAWGIEPDAGVCLGVSVVRDEPIGGWLERTEPATLRLKVSCFAFQLRPYDYAARV